MDAPILQHTSAGPDRLVTRRLVLRQAVAEDIASVVRGLSSLRVTRWLGRAPHPYVAMHARTWFSTQREAQASGEHIALVIAKRDRPALVVGGIGCHGIYDASPMVGYWLAEAHWGRGYASEALGAVLAEVRRINPTARPHAMVRPGNRASIGVLSKAGFKRQTGTCYLQSRALGRNVRTLRYLAAAPDRV